MSFRLRHVKDHVNHTEPALDTPLNSTPGMKMGKTSRGYKDRSHKPREPALAPGRGSDQDQRRSRYSGNYQGVCRVERTVQQRQNVGMSRRAKLLPAMGKMAQDHCSPPRVGLQLIRMEDGSMAQVDAPRRLSWDFGNARKSSSPISVVS